MLDAALAFVSKDKTQEQAVEVELEELISKKMQNFEVLDDALYAINRTVMIATRVTSTGPVPGPGPHNNTNSVTTKGVHSKVLAKANAE